MKKIILATLSLAFFLIACKNGDSKKEEPTTKEPNLKEETVSYKVDTLNMNSYLVYDENGSGKRPLVLGRSLRWPPSTSSHLL